MAPDKAISQSIQRGILAPSHARRRSLFTRLIAFVFAFFALFQLRLTRRRNDLFRKLRNETWFIDEDGYERSFAQDDSLKTVGRMGYSGSVSGRLDFEIERLTGSVFLRYIRWQILGQVCTKAL